MGLGAEPGSGQCPGHWMLQEGKGPQSSHKWAERKPWPNKPSERASGLREHRVFLPAQRGGSRERQDATFCSTPVCPSQFQMPQAQTTWEPGPERPQTCSLSLPRSLLFVLLLLLLRLSPPPLLLFLLQHPLSLCPPHPRPPLSKASKACS